MMGRVTGGRRHRESGAVEADAEETGEHGPGAARLSADARSGRARPLQRGSVAALREALCREAGAKQGGNAAFAALDDGVGGGFFMGIIPPSPAQANT